MVRFCFAAQIIAVEIQDQLFKKWVAGGFLAVTVLTAGVIILSLLNPIAGIVIICTGAVFGLCVGYKIIKSLEKPIDMVADVDIELQNIPTVKKIYSEFKNLKMLIPNVDEYGFNVAQMKFIENLTK
jgi:hypothetical protein